MRFFDQTFILSVNIVIIDNQTLKLSINIDNWSLIDNQALRLSININNWTLIINNQPLIICGGLWSPSTVPCRMYDTEAGEIHSLVNISKTLRMEYDYNCSFCNVHIFCMTNTLWYKLQVFNTLHESRHQSRFSYGPCPPKQTMAASVVDLRNSNYDFLPPPL